MDRKTFDPEKFNFSTARLKKGGENFEIVIDPEKAIAYKEGKITNINDVIKSEEIFSDAQHGMLSKENLFLEIFNTEDKEEICRQILGKGELHLTAEFKRKHIERKKRGIIEFIRKNGIDSITGYPHTYQRIENALDESKVHIDEYKSVEEQAKKIIKQIYDKIPIKIEKKKLRICVSARYSSSVIDYCKKVGSINKNLWDNQGCWVGELEIPAGIEVEFYDKLNKITKGSAEIESIK
ncbi:MAG: ribosome assembly factor SBDS [Nanobdellota archaeon]